MQKKKGQWQKQLTSLNSNPTPLTKKDRATLDSFDYRTRGVETRYVMRSFCGTQ